MQAFKAALRIVMNHPTYLIVYVGFLSLMGVFITSSLSLGGDEPEYAAAKPTFAVIDRDGSELSEGLAAFLSERGEQVQVADDAFAMQDAVATGQVHCLLIVPEGYGADFLDAARSGEDAPAIESSYSYAAIGGTLVDEQANQFLGLARAAAALEPDASVSAVLDRAGEAASTSVDVETMQTPNAGIPADRFAFYLQWGTYTTTASVVVCVGLLMAAFNRTELRRRNSVAPLSSLGLGLQKAAGCLLVTFVVWAATCGIGLAIFGSSLAGVPGGAVALVLLSAFVFALVPLSLGFLLGQLGATEMATNAVGNISGMVMSFLGGAWISLDLLGPEVQALSKFIPTYWYTDAVSQSIHLTDVTFSSVAPVLGNLGIVALFAAALFAIALVAGRVRMQSSEAGGNAGAAMARG